jgi:putative transcriptional regulator
MKEVKIANQLKLARTAVGLTQEELAERAGVTRQTIGLIEAGKYNPSLKLLMNALKAKPGKWLLDSCW